MIGYSKKYQARRGNTLHLARAKKSNKYRAKKKKYGERLYDSTLEANLASRLDLLMKAKSKSERVIEWIPQYQIELRVFGKLIAKHKVDFYVRYADGSEELLEAKGYETREWLMIRRLIEVLLPKGLIENTKKSWKYRVIRK